MSVFDAVRLDFECAHDETAIRVYTASNGTQHYRAQCLGCGAMVRAFKKAELTAVQLRDAEPWDAALPETWHARFMATYRERSEDESARAREAARAEYEAYRRSPEWQAKRRRVLERERWVCQGCGVARAEVVHHLTYDRIYREMLFDLVALCRPCHESVHGIAGDADTTWDMAPRVAGEVA